MKRRLIRLIPEDGRLLIVALDHTVVRRDIVPGLESYEDSLKKVIASEPDAVMVGLGTLRSYPEWFGRTPTIVTPDPQSALEPSAVTDLALRVGADAVKTYVFPYVEGDRSVAALSSLANAADKAGLPVIAEPFPGGFKTDDDMRSVDVIAAAARLCAEAGADMVKSLYAGSSEAMSKVVDYAQVPVVVLGGAERPDLIEVLRMVQSSMAAGCIGAAVGKNIFNAADPRAATQALLSVIHQNLSPEDAAMSSASRKPTD